MWYKPLIGRKLKGWTLSIEWVEPLGWMSGGGGGGLGVCHKFQCQQIPGVGWNKEKNHKMLIAKAPHICWKGGKHVTRLLNHRPTLLR